MILINCLEECDKICGGHRRKSAEKTSLEHFPGKSIVFNDGLYYITSYITEANANFA